MRASSRLAHCVTQDSAHDRDVITRDIETFEGAKGEVAPAQIGIRQGIGSLDFSPKESQCPRVGLRNVAVQQVAALTVNVAQGGVLRANAETPFVEVCIVVDEGDERGLVSSEQELPGQLRTPNGRRRSACQAEGARRLTIQHGVDVTWPSSVLRFRARFSPPAGLCHSKVYTVWLGWKCLANTSAYQA